MAQGLCDECKSITVENLKSPRGHKIDTSSLRAECALCQLISNIGRTKIWCELMFDGLPPVLKGDSPFEWKWYPVFIMTKEGDPVESLGIPAANLSLTTTRCEKTFRFINWCLNNCAEKHECGRSIFKQDRSSGHLPRRLIDVQPFDDVEATSSFRNDVRLVEIEGDCPPYMTLSHCWGGSLSAAHTTRTSNIAFRTAWIPISSLPTTFRHAIEITRRVGIRYLWIDALCIIQDSPIDWAQESAKMGYIYDGSLLTIAATASHDSFGGCFNNSGTTQDQLDGGKLVEVTQTLPDGRESDLLFWSPRFDPRKPLSEPTPLKESPLSERGWVFQERILSPRTVHFTRHQLVWECREAYETEDRLPFITDHETRSLSVTQTIRKGDLRSIWYDWLVGGEYASRKFTRIEDRQIAVGGVAKSLQERTGAKYIAGLWDVELQYGLSWISQNSSSLQKALASSDDGYFPTQERRRPTWTWASSNSEFKYPDHMLPDIGFTLVSVSLKLSDHNPDPFGRVVGGSITVRGRLSSFLSDYGTVTEFFDLPSLQQRYYKQRIYILLGDLIVRESYQQFWLALGQTDDGDLSFERLGIAKVVVPEVPIKNRSPGKYDGTIETITLY